jgi:NAD(P)-dependent dehydrogenase (short-subunit alcohol dehydrogenase family)
MGSLTVSSSAPSVYSKYILMNVVLINNAGIATIDRKAYTDTHQSLSALREQYNVILNTNLTSVAVVTTAFLPLLRASPSPKVINITSGFASITVRLKAGSFPSRAAVYASSKVGMNGMTVQMQVAERDVPEDVPKIKYYVVQPGLLKTAFTGFREGARDPRDGAEVVTRLVMDEEGKYEKGMYWQFEKGEMLEVPW